MPHVVVITFCRSLDLLYGSTLVFETLRVGFPEAEVLVYDNGSIPEAVRPIQEEARQVGAKFVQGPTRPHHEVLREVLRHATNSVVVLDPDVVFWKRVDKAGTSKPVAGRLLPVFYDTYTKCYTKPRLHTSFLRFNEPQKIWKEVEEVQKTHFEWSPFSPVMVCENETWIRYDTMSQFYMRFPEFCESFSEDILDSYDHLFCGSHKDLVDIDEDFFHESHQAAKEGDLEAIRGVWRLQQRFLEER